MLRLGMFPEIVLVVAIFISLCCLATRLYMLHGMISLSIHKYIKEVILNILTVTIAAIVLPAFISIWSNVSLTSFIGISIISIVASGTSIYYIGCKRNERMFIHEKTVSFLCKIGIVND